MFGSGAWTLGSRVTTGCSSSSVCVALALGAASAVLMRPPDSAARLRAAVDDPRVAAGLGIPVDRDLPH
jgi:branched-subunit amino acid ABC-type transport system permease component